MNKVMFGEKREPNFIKRTPLKLLKHWGGSLMPEACVASSDTGTFHW